jgi:plasmid stabilization system protein ParE
MANKRIDWARRAFEQFESALRYIAIMSPQNAEKVRQDLINEIEKTAKQPEFHPPDKFKSNNTAGKFRAFEKHRIRIAYFASEDYIRILRVRHTSREPKTY